MSRRPAPRALRAALLIGLPAALAACVGQGDQGPPPAAPPPTPAAPQVKAAGPAQPDARGMIFMDGYVLAVARAGDTLETLAARTGADAVAIASYNGLPANYVPRAGDEVVLPPKLGGYARLAAPAAGPAGAAAAARPLSAPIEPMETLETLPEDAVAAAPDGRLAGDAPEAGAGAGPAGAPGPNNAEWSAARIADAIARGEQAPAQAQAQAAPAASEQAPVLNGGRDIVYHEVQPGETVADIAARYGATMDQVASWNALAGPAYRVTPGQVLTVPVEPGAQAARGANPVELPGQAGATLPPPESAAQPKPADSIAPRPLASPQLGQYQQAAEVPAPRAVDAPAAPEEQAQAVASLEEAAPAPAAAPAAPEAAPADDGGRFLRPVPGRVLSPYNQGTGPDRNDGVDFDAAPGERVRASADGTVALVSTSLGDWGSIVLVRHEADYMTVYGRLGAVNVSKGQRIKRGDIVGQVATPTGDNPAMLHYEVRRGAFSEDPMTFFE
ncbi:peptidoglycan DD-metalloendopeptidase family protein [Rhodovulum sp. DZ06]|uniref:peptidoglycan DD-metalloendopeptidase family protein n=1 Tax=Rhodovulum sp. DZ06 TaxID=3425126 RepID=UPI003D343625